MKCPVLQTFHGKKGVLLSRRRRSCCVELCRPDLMGSGLLWWDQGTSQPVSQKSEHSAPFPSTSGGHCKSTVPCLKGHPSTLLHDLRMHGCSPLFPSEWAAVQKCRCMPSAHYGGQLSRHRLHLTSFKHICGEAHFQVSCLRGVMCSTVYPSRTNEHKFPWWYFRQHPLLLNKRLASLPLESQPALPSMFVHSVVGDASVYAAWKMPLQTTMCCKPFCARGPLLGKAFQHRVCVRQYWQETMQGMNMDVWAMRAIVETGQRTQPGHPPQTPYTSNQSLLQESSVRLTFREVKLHLQTCFWDLNTEAPLCKHEQ